MPSLSIVMPNYNDSRYLPRAISSVLAQSFADFELIVVDDGSSDGSVEIIRDFQNKDSRIRLIALEKNVGVCEAARLGNSEASGEFIMAGASVDDFPEPFHFESSVQLLAQHPQAAFCFSNVAFTDENGNGHTPRAAIFKADPGYLPPDEAKEWLSFGYIPGASCVMRRSVFLESPGQDIRHFSAADLLYYSMLALRHGACFSPLNGVVVTDRPGSFERRSLGDPELVYQRARNVVATLLEPQNQDVIGRFESSGILKFIGEFEAERLAGDFPPGTVSRLLGRSLEIRGLLRKTPAERARLLFQDAQSSAAGGELIRARVALEHAIADGLPPEDEIVAHLVCVEIFLEEQNAHGMLVHLSSAADKAFLKGILRGEVHQKLLSLELRKEAAEFAAMVRTKALPEDEAWLAHA